jgi:Na+/H+-dicarboxylate symporter
MHTFSKISLPFRIILTGVFIAVTVFLLSVSQRNPDNGPIMTVTFLSVLLTLFMIFNLVPVKLYLKILIGLLLGALTGIFLGDAILLFEPVGRVFIRLIKMIVVPLVFASLLVGTASVQDIKKLGRIGLKTILFYLISTALAVSIGLTIANILKPGSTLPEDVRAELGRDYMTEADSKLSGLEQKSPVELLVDIIPENPIKAMADNDMLQVIFFALMAGIALTYLADKRKTVIISFFDGISEIMIKLVQLIMRLAPYGVFALIAAVTGRFGTAIILSLAGYFSTTLIALFIHVVLFNSLVVRFMTGVTVRQFWSGISQALLVAFSSSSSSATLPVTMECAQDNLQVRPEVASFVLPLGSTINMDGTAIFQGVSAVFIATIYGIGLTFADQLTIVLTATLASIGTAGAPQVGIIMLTMVLQAIGVPIEVIALILGVERFLDMARTMVNVTSDLSCACFINRQEV